MIVWVGAFTWDFSVPSSAFISLVSCFVIFIGIQASLVGYFVRRIDYKERLLLGMSPICLMIYLATRSIMWFVVGIGILIILFLWERRQRKVLSMIR